MGIPQETIQHIFASFTQADTSTTRKFEGAGLGLSITRALIELMGGHIAVESKQGEGSTFIFTIKLYLSQKQNVPERQKSEDYPQNCRLQWAN